MQFKTRYIIAVERMKQSSDCGEELDTLLESIAFPRTVALQRARNLLVRTCSTGK